MDLFLNRKAWDPDWEPLFVFLMSRLGDKALTARDPRPAERLINCLSRGEDDNFRHRLALACLVLGELPKKFIHAHMALISEIIVSALDFCWSNWCWDKRDLVSHVISRLSESLKIAALFASSGVWDWLVARLKTSNEAASLASELLRGVPADSRNIRDLCQLMASSIPSVRIAALETIRGWGLSNPVIIRQAVESLEDSDKRVRFAAVSLFRKLGPNSAIPEIIPCVLELAINPQWPVRAAAASVLYHMRIVGEPVFASRFGLLTNSQIYALFDLGREAPPVWGTFEHSDPHVRELGIRLVTVDSRADPYYDFDYSSEHRLHRTIESPGSEVPRFLVAALRDPSPSVRQAALVAVAAFAQSWDQEILDHFLDLLGDQSAEVRRMAVASMDRLQRTTPVRALFMGIAPNIICESTERGSCGRVSLSC